MKYNLDTGCLSIPKYKALLQSQNLLPGRRVLLENMDVYFALLEQTGIKNVAQLKKSLARPQKIAAFAADSGIPAEYLVILKREMNSLEQKPVALASFPGIESALLESLNNAGIKTSKQYFESKPAAEELLCLCDLVRINGVGPVAARAFYDAGYRSVQDIADADAACMLETVSQVNAVKQYYKARLGQKDMQFCIDFARLLLDLCK